MAKVAIDVSNADNAVELAKRCLERVKWSCSLGAHPDAHAPSPSSIVHMETNKYEQEPKTTSEDHDMARCA
jgi:hypothetical protein